MNILEISNVKYFSATKMSACIAQTIKIRVSKRKNLPMFIEHYIVNFGIKVKYGYKYKVSKYRSSSDILFEFSKNPDISSFRFHYAVTF